MSEILNKTPEPKVEHYLLVTVQIIFNDGVQTAGHTVQFFNKSDTDTIPSPRLQHLQKLAAAKTKQELNLETFTPLQIQILSIIPLGWMTEEQFWGPKEEEVSKPETKKVDNLIRLDPIRPN